MKLTRALLCIAVAAAGAHADDASHSHPAPEKLGAVTFETTCDRAVQPRFERAVALLHSFAYAAARDAFRDVAASDPGCAIAHWGVAMSYYNQLWEPPKGDDLRAAESEIRLALATPAKSARERAFIDAAAVYYRDAEATPHADRAKAYAKAMADVAARNPTDTEAQVFDALALLATASPTDRTHANAKRAVAILEPLYRKHPDHPGLAHYLIHACDNAELAPHGLAAARDYAKIAPAVPHALHMPSHIFTRLGDWNDAIASNIAARDAALREDDTGEALHAMDYLVYAYLQRGQDAAAERIAAEMRAMGAKLSAANFKIGYAANAIPVRLAVERKRWDDALSLEPLPGSEPHVAAIVYWARAMARARSGRAETDDVAALDECLRKLKAAGNDYWATQTELLSESAHAWQLEARGAHAEAVTTLTLAADKEDAIEKRPVTPGAIIPAREQLADLLLANGKPADALREYEAVLAVAPGRRAALAGAAIAAQQSRRAEG